jgi:undecaprenyl diphosphate synthase
MNDSIHKKGASVPANVAIIMDGNGRWAKQRGKIRSLGHQAGFKATREIVEACVRRGIHSLTLFAFSSENWKRPEQEVGLLMDLFMRALKSEVSKLHTNNVRMRFIGDISAFSSKLQKQMTLAEEKTQLNTGLELIIAVNYGGRWDIVNAAKQLAIEVQQGAIQPDDICIDTFSKRISLHDVGDPDLFIRTGGEKRISNYLLWNLAYTELYFTDALWPDFNAEELDKALQVYSKRQRRFGMTGEQVEVNNA